MIPTPLSTKFEVNAKIAAANRASFALDGVTAVSLVGPSGSGKTSVIEAVARRLEGRIRVAAVIGNPAATRDVERLLRLGVRAVPVVTENLAALDVQQALADLNLPRTDLVFLESGGNALSPVEFDLGQDLRAAVFSVSGGDEKAAEHARLVAESDVVLLTKVDLLPHVTFDLDVFRADVAAANPAAADVLLLSARGGQGVEAWLDWLSKRWSPDKSYRALDRCPASSDCFLG